MIKKFMLSIIFLLTISTTCRSEPSPEPPLSNKALVGHWAMYWDDDEIYDTYFNQNEIYSATGILFKWEGTWCVKDGVLWVSETTDLTNPNNWKFWGVILDTKFKGKITEGRSFRNINIKLVKMKK